MHQKLSLADLGWNAHFEARYAEACSAFAEGDRLKPVRVVAVHRGHVDCLSELGEQTLAMGGVLRDTPVAAGDWLLVDAQQRLQLVLPRRTEFKRPAAGTGREWQLIAANVDVLFIVASCNQDFNLARLERYLVLAEEAGAWPVIVLTKSDLCEDAEAYRGQAAQLRAGVMVELVNALDSVSVQGLASWCEPGQTVALVGSSGVGKSTLVNNLMGYQTLATASIREDDAKGRHTTTVRSMHRLPNGSWLMDTPGMRELKLADVQEGLQRVFDDITSLATQCRFSDCQHDDEPCCAVQAAIVAGSLEPDRLQRYLKLLREEARSSESLAERHAREREFGRMVKNIVANKRER